MKTIKLITFFVLLIVQFLIAQNFWQQTNGPYGGATVNDFLLYEDSIIFLATDEGIIISSDNGASWQRIADVVDKTSCIAVDRSGLLYAGVKNINDNGYLYKSLDGGNTWSYNYMGMDIRDILITYSDTIMVGSWDRGLWRSFDRATNWTQINNGIQYTGIYEIILLSNGSLLVGTSGGGVYKTTNWGDLWIPSNTGISGSGYLYNESFCETEPGHVFTGALSGIYYSTNYGDSWVYKSTGCTNKVASCIVKDGYGILYAGTRISSGVYYSTNNGDNWYYLGLGHSIYTIGWDSESRLYAGGSSDGLYGYVVDDSTWTQVYNQGYTPIQVNKLCLTQSGNLLANTEWWGLQYTSNNGELWTRTNYHYQGNGPNEPYDIATINDSIFIAGESSNAYVSNDYGNTWIATGYFHVQSLYANQKEQTIYLGTDRSTNDICGVYKSVDFGENWELLYAFPLLTPYQRILELYASEENRIILASIDYYVGPPVYSGYYLFHLSTDYGQSWEIIYSEEYDPVSYIVQDQSSNLFALADDKLLLSEDNGNSWITKVIPGSDCLASDHSGRIYRARFSLYYSIDKGITWITIPNSGLQGAINDVVINQHNRIYVATDKGVFYGEGDSLVVSVENFKPVETFHLSQNYPNPFNPATKIKFEIPDQVRYDSRLVTLKVYDVLGNEVATLVNEEKQPGIYEVEFNPSSIKHLPSSGVYFYQLKSGNFVETKKMLLLK
jgi:photosystem II stability/assembly factor-like uncharacterized protein